MRQGEWYYCLVNHMEHTLSHFVQDWSLILHVYGMRCIKRIYGHHFATSAKAIYWLSIGFLHLLWYVGVE